MDLTSSNQGENFGGSYVSCGRVVTENRHIAGYCDPPVSLGGWFLEDDILEEDDVNECAKDFPLMSRLEIPSIFYPVGEKVVGNFDIAKVTRSNILRDAVLLCEKFGQPLEIESSNSKTVSTLLNVPVFKLEEEFQGGIDSIM